MWESDLSTEGSVVSGSSFKKENKFPEEGEVRAEVDFVSYELDN